MKIVLAPVGSNGDTRPLLALGLAQREKGNEIVICAPPNYRDLFQDYDFEFHPVGLDVKALMIDQAENIMGKQGRNNKLLLRFLRDDISRQFDGLIKNSRDADYIVGSGLQFAGQSIAEKAGIPYHQVLHVPQILASRHHPPPTIPWQNLPHWLNRIAWYMSNSGLNIMLRKTINEERKKLDLKPIIDVYSYFSRKMIIAIDKDLAVVPNDVTSDYIQTGYWYLEQNAELDKELIDFIRSGEPPVYLGFGSIPDPDSSKTNKILRETFESLNVRVTIAKGWANLGEGLESDTIKLIDFVSHAKLFPKVAAVIHHGGAGTVVTAARAGVPQIIIPHVLDQYYWAERIYRLKLGPRTVSRSKLTSGYLRNAIQKTLTNPEYVENARQLGKKLQEANSRSEMDIF